MPRGNDTDALAESEIESTSQDELAVDCVLRGRSASKLAWGNHFMRQKEGALRVRDLVRIKDGKKFL